jgi:glycosyltransferase
MRILFTAFSGGPHLYLMVPVAWACRAAGHDVRIATTPAYVDDLTRIGLPGVTVGGGPPRYTAAAAQALAADVYSQPPWPADWAAHPDRLNEAQCEHLRAQGRYGVALAETMVDDLIEYGRRWRPHVLVYDAVTFAGAAAAAGLGIPGVRHLYGAAAAARVELSVPDQRPLPEYLALFDRLDAEPAPPASHLDITPPRMRLVERSPRIDVRYVPYNGTGLVPRVASTPRRRPRACVTWGTSAVEVLGRAAADPYRDAIRWLAASHVEVLVLTTAAQFEALGDLPDGVQGLSGVPLHLVLPHCDVLVQQGGEGTTLTGAAAGVPQVAVTRKPDTELTAGRMAATGAGVHLRYQELRNGDAGAAIGEAVHQVLTTPFYLDSADRLRAEIEAQPAPGDVVPDITALARTTVGG